MQTKPSMLPILSVRTVFVYRHEGQYELPVCKYEFGENDVLDAGIIVNVLNEYEGIETGLSLTSFINESILPVLKNETLIFQFKERQDKFGARPGIAEITMSYNRAWLNIIEVQAAKAKTVDDIIHISRSLASAFCQKACYVKSRYYLSGVDIQPMLSPAISDLSKIDIHFKRPAPHSDFD